MRYSVLLAIGVFLAAITSILCGCGGGGSSNNNNNTNTSQVGSYSVVPSATNPTSITYTPPTTLTTPVTGVLATFTAVTAGAPTPIYAAFTASQTNPITYTLDISSQSTALIAADKGTYTFTVTATLSDNTQATISPASGMPTQVVLDGGTGNSNGPPPPPF